MDALRIRRPLAVLAIAVAISIGLRSAAAVAQDAVVQYVYDEVGRLIAVVDQPGNVALCTYDATGNVLRIDRVDPGEIPGPLGVALGRPKRGKAGTVVDIFGLDIRAVLRPPGRAAVDARGLVGALPSGSTSQGTSPAPRGVGRHAWAWLADRRLLLAGGSTQNGPTDLVEIVEYGRATVAAAPSHRDRPPRLPSCRMVSGQISGGS